MITKTATLKQAAPFQYQRRDKRSEHLKLKVKAKSLAAEAKIIQREERLAHRHFQHNLHYSGQQDRPHWELDSENQANFNSWNSLREHRVNDVRNESRATHLARAYLKGKPYSSVERKCHNEWHRYYYVRPRVITMICKYGYRAHPRHHGYEELKTEVGKLVDEWFGGTDPFAK